MGEAAENKILLLLKQTRREEETEANKLLRILRNRTRNKEPEREPVQEPAPPPAIPEVFSIPGLSALHLFSFLREEAASRAKFMASEKQDGWLRHFLCIEPFVAVEIAGLPGHPLNKELRDYRTRLNLLLHRLLVQWRLSQGIVPEDLQTKELDDSLIHLVEKLKILVQQGRLQQVNTLESNEKLLTFLCVLKPDSFTTASRFLKRNKGSLFAHLSFMVTLMAQEAVASRPGQLKGAIAMGESLQRLREKLLILIQRLSMRSNLVPSGWEEDARLAILMTSVFNQLDLLFSETKPENASSEGGENGLL